MEGPVGWVKALGVAFEYLHKKIEAAEQQAQKFAALEWSAQIQSLNEATESAHNLADALTKAAKIGDPIKAQYEDGLAVLNAHVEAHKKILKALEAEDLAAAGNDRGRQQEIKARYAMAETNYDTQVGVDKQQKQEEERQGYEAGAAFAKKEAEQALQQIQAAETDPKFLAARNFVENATDKEKEEVGRARVIVQKEGGKEAVRNLQIPIIPQHEKDVQNRPDYGGFREPTPISDRAMEVERARDALKLLDEFDRHVSVVAKQNENIRQLKKAREDYAAQAERDTKAATEIRAAQSTERKTDDQKEAGEDVGEAISIEKKILAGGKANQGEEEFLRTIGTVIAGHNVTLQTAEKMFEVAGKNSHAMDAMMNQLADVMGRMSDTVLKNFLNRLNSIDQNIGILESRLKESHN